MAENIDIKDKLVTNEDLKVALQFVGGGGTELTESEITTCFTEVFG